MKKVLRNALKPAAERQSEAVQFKLTKANKKKLGKYPNKRAKQIVLDSLDEV